MSEQKLYSTAAVIHKRTDGGLSVKMMNGWRCAVSHDEAVGKWFQYVQDETPNDWSIAGLDAVEITDSPSN